MAVLPPAMTPSNSFIASHSSALDSGMINSAIKDPARVPLCLVVILPVGISILAIVFVLVIMERLRQRKKACRGSEQITSSAAKYTGTLKSSTRVHAGYIVIFLLTSLIVCSSLIANTVDLVRSIFTDDRIRWINRQKAALLLEGIREVYEVDAYTLENFRLGLVLNRLKTDARIRAAGTHLENGIIDAVSPCVVDR